VRDFGVDEALQIGAAEKVTEMVIEPLRSDPGIGKGGAQIVLVKGIIHITIDVGFLDGFACIPNVATELIVGMRHGWGAEGVSVPTKVSP
jgi:hypothetical protein